MSLASGSALLSHQARQASLAAAQQQSQSPPLKTSDLNRMVIGDPRSPTAVYRAVFVIKDSQGRVLDPNYQITDQETMIRIMANAKALVLSQKLDGSHNGICIKQDGFALYKGGRVTLQKYNASPVTELLSDNTDSAIGIACHDAAANLAQHVAQGGYEYRPTDITGIDLADRIHELILKNKYPSTPWIPKTIRDAQLEIELHSEHLITHSHGSEELQTETEQTEQLEQTEQTEQLEQTQPDSESQIQQQQPQDAVVTNTEADADPASDETPTVPLNQINQQQQGDVEIVHDADAAPLSIPSSLVDATDSGAGTALATGSDAIVSLVPSQSQSQAQIPVTPPESEQDDGLFSESALTKSKTAQTSLFGDDDDAPHDDPLPSPSSAVATSKPLFGEKDVDDGDVLSGILTQKKAETSLASQILAQEKGKSETAAKFDVDELFKPVAGAKIATFDIFGDDSDQPVSVT